MALIFGPLKFECLGNDRSGSFHPNGFIMNNSMPQPEIKESDSICLYRKNYQCANVLESDGDFEQLVLLTRRAYIYIDNAKGQRMNSRGYHATDAIADHTDTPTSLRLSDLRNEISKFLRFVHLSLKLPISNGALNRNEKDLRGLKLYFDKFSFTHWPHTMISAALDGGKESNLLAFHAIHCHLDFRWLFLNIVSKLDDLKKSAITVQVADDLMPLSFEHEADVLMSELMYVSILSYESYYNNENGKSSAFPCVCFKEIWLLLIHFPYKIESFWARLNKVLCKVHDVAKKYSNQSSDKSHKEYYPGSMRRQFSIWFISEIASLQRYNNKGELSSSNRTIESNYEKLHDEVKKVMSEPEPPDEAEMQIILSSIRDIVDIWGCEGSKTLIWDFWDYYSKKLNSTFYQPGNSLSTLMVVSKTGPDLIEQLQFCIEGSRQFKNENSYFIWLRLLSIQLRHGRSKGMSASHLCSRIFIKFSIAHKNRLRDLSELGLFHIVNLYLCLAICTNSPTVINKLVEMLSTIPRDDITEGKHDMIWKGYSAALITQESLKGDLTDNVQLVLNHVDWCIKLHKHSEILHLVNTTTFLFQKKITTANGVSKLIGPWIKSYIMVARNHAVLKLFSSFVPLMKTLCSLRDNISSTPHLQELYTQLENHVFPLVPDQKNSTGAELAAYFTLLSAKYGAELFQNWSEVQDCTLRGKYLSTLINTDISAVQPQFPQIIGLALQTWVKWFCYCGRTDDTEQLGAALFQLPPMSVMSSDWSCDDPLIAVIEHFGTEFKYCQSIQEKAAVRKLFYMFFHQFDKWMDQQLKNINGISSDAIFRMFRYSASLFVKCPHLIYIRSNPRGLLTTIVETLLLPSDLYKRDYRIPSALKNPIAGNLRNFIEGLIALDTDADAFIGRLLRDTVQQYITHLEELGYDGYVALLRNPTFSAPLLKHILPLLSIRGNEPTIQAINVLKLFQMVICDTPTAVDRAAAENIFEKVIPSVLEFVISLSESSKSLKTKAIGLIASSIASQQNRQMLLIALTESCKKHVSFNSEKWFRAVQKIGMLFPLDLRASLNEIAEKEVIEVEKRRRVSRDPALRSQLNAMVGALSDTMLF